MKSVCINLWRKFLVNANETWLTYLDENSDFDIYPNIGVIGTPVIDRTGGAIYVVSRSTGTTTYFQRLHALNITDGTEKLNGRALNTFTEPRSRLSQVSSLCREYRGNKVGEDSEFHCALSHRKMYARCSRIA